MVPIFVVEMTAQIVTREGSQIATRTNEKFFLADIVFLSESV
jgi:hypothetical protein